MAVQHKCSLRDTTMPYYWESTSGHADCRQNLICSGTTHNGDHSGTHIKNHIM